MSFFFALSVLLLYIVMEFRATPAIIACVIMLIGALFSVFAVAQNLYYWRVEKTRADKSVIICDKKTKVGREGGINQSELSTLV